MAMIIAIIIVVVVGLGAAMLLAHLTDWESANGGFYCGEPE